MARRKGKQDPKRLLLIVGAAVIAFLLYRKLKANAAANDPMNQSVPFTPSGYFYADPFGGAGASSYGGGTASQPVAGTGTGGTTTTPVDGGKFKFIAPPPNSGGVSSKYPGDWRIPNRNPFPVADGGSGHGLPR